MRYVLLLLAAIASTGCALETDYVEVRHRPAAATVPPAPGAGLVGLTVETRDARSSNRDRVSVKKNGYGMEMAPIIATNDVIAETRQAITGDLEARGFRIPGGDGRIEVEVLRFFSEFRAGFWSGAAVADLSVNVRVSDRGGQLVFARTYTAEGINPEIQIASGENARLALETGLQRLVRTVGDDPDLLRALVALAPPPQPRRAGRPTS